MRRELSLKTYSCRIKILLLIVLTKLEVLLKEKKSTIKQKKALKWHDNAELMSIRTCTESQEWQKWLHKFEFIYSFMSIIIFSVLDFKILTLNLWN